MAENTWFEYVKQTIGSDTYLAAARRVGMDSSAFTRWSKGEAPGVGFVTKFARGYDRNVIEALVAAGFITDAEANLRNVNVGVADLSTEALAAELHERLRTH